MYMNGQTIKFGIFTLLVAFFLPFNLDAAERWYNKDQVDKGKAVFNTNCAICHGIDAAGTPEWRKPMKDGRYPPPPLNGTAHGWHHNLESLRRQINQGGFKYGGWMPAFGDSLTAEQVDAVIAYFQSFWSDQIFTAWLKRSSKQSIDPLATEQAAEKPVQNNILIHLPRRLPNSKFGEPKETPLKGIFRLSMDDSIIYVSGDGRYVFLRDMVDRVEGRNITKTGIP
jgi:mono/diheme cytochrome c family protein